MKILSLYRAFVMALVLLLGTAHAHDMRQLGKIVSDDIKRRLPGVEIEARKVLQNSSSAEEAKDNARWTLMVVFQVQKKYDEGYRLNQEIIQLQEQRLAQYPGKKGLDRNQDEQNQKLTFYYLRHCVLANKLNRPQEALRACRRAQEMNVSFKGMLGANVGHALLLQGRLAEAQKWYEYAVSQFRFGEDWEESRTLEGVLQADFDWFLQRGWSTDHVMAMRAWFNRNKANYPTNLPMDDDD